MVNKNPVCKCGGKIICVDNHYLCEYYYEDIKRGVEEQQQIIDELQN